MLLLGVVCFNLSSLVKHVTRFTYESFVCLATVVFIVDTITFLLESNQWVKKEHTESRITHLMLKLNYNFSFKSIQEQEAVESVLIQAHSGITFYFSIILVFLAFTMCTMLNRLRHTSYLTTSVIHFNLFFQCILI